MSAAKGRDQAVKVVIINTQYIETDPHSFKSIVQKLTGKDSTVPDSAVNSCKHPATPAAEGARLEVGLSSGNNRASVPRALSFKIDFDRLIREMPTADEFEDLCINN